MKQTLNKLRKLLSAPYKIVIGNGIAIPNHNINLSQPFNERKHEFLLKCRVFPTIYKLIPEQINNKRSKLSQITIQKNKQLQDIIKKKY